MLGTALLSLCVFTREARGCGRRVTIARGCRRGVVALTTGVSSGSPEWQREEARWEREAARWNAERSALLAELAAQRSEINFLRDVVGGSRSFQASPPPEGGRATDTATTREAERADAAHEHARALAAEVVRLRKSKAAEAAPMQQLRSSSKSSNDVSASPAGGQSGDGDGSPDPDVEVLDYFRPAGDAASPSLPSPADDRPVLSLGADDVSWVANLQSSLEAKGFWSGEEDMADWRFGDGTHAALLTFQATAGLDESGVTDGPTWAALLGDVEAGPQGVNVDAGDDKSVHITRHHGPTAGLGAIGARGSWPLLSPDDGGSDVHHLQVALTARGYFCGSDDMQWWMLGQATELALRSFQACMGLPETGTTYAATWETLLDGGPELLVDLSGSREDMNRRGVYLIGEDRWEREDP